MIEILNKKRKKITTLSLILTLLIIALSVVIISFTIDHIIIMFITAFIMVTLLYLLSSKIIMPKYQVLVSDIIEESFKSKFELIKVKPNKIFNTDLEIFFPKQSIVFVDSFLIENNNNELFIEHFKISEKKKETDNKFDFKGVILKANINVKFTKELLAISCEYTDSKTFQKTADEHFVGGKFKSQNTIIGKYYTNATKKEDLDIITKICKSISSFHIILYKNNCLYLLFKEQNNSFSFNLKEKIDINVIENCKESYNNIQKVMLDLEDA